MKLFFISPEIYNTSQGTSYLSGITDTSRESHKNLYKPLSHSIDSTDTWHGDIERRVYKKRGIPSEKESFRLCSITLGFVSVITARWGNL